VKRERDRDRRAAGQAVRRWGTGTLTKSAFFGEER
jgi:hypothetical protein